MSKKNLEHGDMILFYHWDFDEKVVGFVKEICPNNMLQVAFDHPKCGIQLLGLHTSAVEVV